MPAPSQHLQQAAGTSGLDNFERLESALTPPNYIAFVIFFEGTLTPISHQLRPHWEGEEHDLARAPHTGTTGKYST